MMALVLAIFVISLASAFAQVDTAWVRRYKRGDYASAIAVDSSGNVYVTGAGAGYATIKYHPNGDSAWARSYNGGDDAYSIAVDASGNVYVTGLGNGWDYATIKYLPNGDTAWVRRYEGSAHSYDAAYAIAVDGFGNVYVTGESDDSVTDADYATIKYYSNGDTVWVRRYDGRGGGRDLAIDIAVDRSGNVYVTGRSLTFGDCATIKYYPNGDTAWVRRYNESGNTYESGWAITVDSSGYVYVTGGGDSSGTFDYLTIKYYPNGDIAWVRTYNGPGNGIDDASAIAVDRSGNVYVTGYSEGVGTFEDYATIKYYSDGGTAWVTRYNGPGDSSDWANAITLDGSGNVYVTGESWDTTSSDYATIRYDSLGNEIWVKRYNGSRNEDDYAIAIAVDDSTNVYVTGSSGFDWDYVTIKYIQPSINVISPNGGEIWSGGYQYYIRWSSGKFVGDIKIDYSINSGASFDSLICSNCPNTGQFLWTIPCNVSSNYCRVRVCDAADCVPADTSNADFTITYCVPVLTNYGIIVLLILMVSSTIWIMRRKKLISQRNI